MVRITEKIKEYFEKNCPLLEGKRLGVNCLGEKIGDVGLKVIPCGDALKEYADGGGLREFMFDICVRTPFDNDTQDAIGWASFMEEMEKWILNTASADDMVLDDGHEGINFEIVKTYGVSGADRAGAKLSMRVRLIYEKIADMTL